MSGGTAVEGFHNRLVDVLRGEPRLFYPQDWYWGERFLRAESAMFRHGDGSITVNAGYLANRYINEPEHPRWQSFIWTDDHDSHGNRVYVGGVGQYGCHGFQIHRLLVPDERWVEWRDL